MAVALESCIMDAIHSTVFEAAAQRHRAEDIALHAFLEQLMAGEYELYGTSPDLQVRVSQLNPHQYCQSKPCKGLHIGEGYAGGGREGGVHAACCSCHVLCKQVDMALCSSSIMRPAFAHQQLPSRVQWLWC